MAFKNDFGIVLVGNILFRLDTQQNPFRAEEITAEGQKKTRLFSAREDFPPTFRTAPSDSERKIY